MYAILLTGVSGGAAIYLKAYDAELERRSSRISAPRQLYPPIPKCDQALWDRIIEGCNDE